MFAKKLIYSHPPGGGAFRQNIFPCSLNRIKLRCKLVFRFFEKDRGQFGKNRSTSDVGDGGQRFDVSIFLTKY